MTRTKDEKLLNALAMMEQIIEPDEHIGIVAQLYDVTETELREAWEDE